MHFHFNFSAVQILWTLTFAALLVLLVVLLGRDRARRFPWFTASMALMALRMVASRLLYGRMAPLVSSEIFLVLAVVAAIVALLVVVEMARRAFSSASRMAWIIGNAGSAGRGRGGVGLVGPVALRKDALRRLDPRCPAAFAVDRAKGRMLADLLVIQLGILVVLFGRRFNAGWRSHVQQIVIGLSTAAMAQLAVRGIWQVIALHTTHSQPGGLCARHGPAGKVLQCRQRSLRAVLVWWIVCLWIDEPGAKPLRQLPRKQASADAEQVCRKRPRSQRRASPRRN